MSDPNKAEETAGLACMRNCCRSVEPVGSVLGFGAAGAGFCVLVSETVSIRAQRPGVPSWAFAPVSWRCSAMACHKAAPAATYRAMRAAGGDRSKQAFEELYVGVSRRLLVYLARRMHDIDAATELWAECWAAAFAGWSRCEARSDGALEAWVFGIARNQLGSYYRSGVIARRGLDQLMWSVPRVLESDRVEIERDAQLGELRALLSEALGRLPTTRRQAAQLRVLKGLSYEEIAARLGCSEPTARARVSRGLRQLERQINHDQVLELQGASQ